MTLSADAASLRLFGVDAERGFLPPTDPLTRLPAAYGAWEEIAGNLPKILVSDSARSFIERLPPFNVSGLTDARQMRRAMMILSYLGHAYVWGEETPPARIPAVLAVPWYQVAQRLERPPVLSYASYALDNWRRLDAEKGIVLGNIALLQNFLGGQDEEWFILVHVDIEAKAAPALIAAVLAQQAAQDNQPAALEGHLATIEQALSQMYATLARMSECCDPYIYYHRVRPYIHGWKNNPATPEGIVYEGVSEYAGKPQCFRGETGAQSSIIPAMDAILGVTHKNDILKEYLMEMRDYMPRPHREFIVALENGPSVRDYVAGKGTIHRTMGNRYDACVTWIERFRSLHLEYAARYIHKQAQSDAANPSTIGTGGTPFMKYLKKHRDETAEHTLAREE